MVLRVPSVTRRQFVVGSSAVATAFWLPKLGFAATGSQSKIVLFTLRGGLDGLHTVPNYGEPSYAQARGAIAIPSPGGTNTALRLDGLFGLHPAFVNLYSMYQAGEAMIVHAVAPPYNGRSHFTAQDILENGTPSRSTPDGWMGRALAARSSGQASATIEALSVGSGNTPLVLEGAPSASAWRASFSNPSAKVRAAIQTLFQSDALLSASYAYVPTLDQMSSIAPDTGSSWKALATQAGQLLASPSGPDVFVLDLHNFDTHQYQGGATGNLAVLLKNLDDAFGALKATLGPLWSTTAVVAMTEFGRTVQQNGTGGTDHGVATAAFVMGGAISGGRVVADWPGTRPQDRFDGRDLRPTTDIRSIYKGILRDHWGFTDAMLDTAVFPNSASTVPMDGLILGATSASPRPPSPPPPPPPATASPPPPPPPMSDPNMGMGDPNMVDPNTGDPGMMPPDMSTPPPEMSSPVSPPPAAPPPEVPSDMSSGAETDPIRSPWRRWGRRSWTESQLEEFSRFMRRSRS